MKVVALLHKSPEDIPSGKSESAPEAREKLTAFRDKVSQGRLVDFWSDANGLPGQVALSMINAIKTFPMVGWIRADKVTNEDALRELNDLRRENGELKEQFLGIEANAIEDIAPLEDVIEIQGTRIYQIGENFEGPTYAEEEWNKLITWEQLFKLIAPYLTMPQSDSDIEKIFVKSFTGGADVDKSSVDHQLLQTIKIQLEAHKLIDFDTNQHGKWMLTPNGRKLMTHLRVIKRQKEVPYALTRSSRSIEPSDN